MEKYIEVNCKWLLSDEHLVITKRGLLKASELVSGDVIYGNVGESVITNIIVCGDRPEAPIVGEV